MTNQDYKTLTIGELRSLLAKLGGAPVNKKKAELIEEIVKIQSGEISPVRSKRGRPANKNRDYSRPYDFSGKEFKTAVCDVFSKEIQERISASGIVEIYPDGYAFVHRNGFSVKSGDVFIERNFVRAHGLRSGDLIVGDGVMQPNRIYKMTSIDLVNGKAVGGERRNFDDCPPKYADEKIDIFSSSDKSLAAMDLFSPIGYGQRSLVFTADDWADETPVVNLIRILGKQSRAKVCCLLVDVNVEDVSAYTCNFDCEIVCTYVNEGADDHVQMAELVFERAKRLAETGEDAIVVINSLKRLALAYSKLSKDFTGEINKEGVEKVKNLFAQGRNLGSGSFTVVGVLSQTRGSFGEGLLIDDLVWCANSMAFMTLDAGGESDCYDIERSRSKNLDKLLNKDNLRLCREIKSLIAQKSLSQSEIYENASLELGVDGFTYCLEKMAESCK